MGAWEDLKRNRLREQMKKEQEEAQQQIDSIINRELSKALTQKLDDAIISGVSVTDTALSPAIYNAPITVSHEALQDAVNIADIPWKPGTAVSIGPVNTGTNLPANTIQPHTMRDHRDSLRKYQALKELKAHISALNQRRTRANDNPIMSASLDRLVNEAQQEKAEREALADLHRAHYFPVGDLEGFRGEVVRINKDTWDHNQITFRAEQSVISHVNLPESFVKITGI